MDVVISYVQMEANSLTCKGGFQTSAQCRILAGALNPKPYGTLMDHLKGTLMEPKP